MTTTTKSTATITYVVRTNSHQGFDTRTTKTKEYTHAVVGLERGSDRNEVGLTWHTSRDLAVKGLASAQGWHSNPASLRIAEVEAHKGAKATVVKRMAAAITAERAEADNEAPASRSEEHT